MTIPLPIIPDTYRCALNYVGSGTIATNVIHIRRTTTGSTATDAFNAIDGSWTLNQLLPLDNLCILQSCDITPLDGVSSTSHFSFSSAAKYTGGTSGDALIAPSAIIKLQTGVRGRANRGRVYLPFISEGCTAGGLITTSGVATNTTNAWANFVSSLTARTPAWELGVASYDRAHSGASAHFTQVLTVSCEAVLATQRRRQNRLR